MRKEILTLIRKHEDSLQALTDVDDSWEEGYTMGVLAVLTDLIKLYKKEYQNDIK